MKKILLIIIVVISLLNVNVYGYDTSYESQNGTYYYLLNQGGFNVDLINNRYVNGRRFSQILNILFKADCLYDVSSMGNITGKDVLNALRDKLSLSVTLIEDRHEHYTRAITFPTMFEMLDNYFCDILAANNLSAEPGTIVKNNDTYFLTYGNGKTKELSSFAGFYVDEKRAVNVISKDDEIIEIIPVDTNILPSQLNDKRELKGTLFLNYYGNIILNCGDEYNKFFTTDSFTILRRTDKEITDREIVLLTGNYRKNINIAYIAVERMDSE